MFGKIGHFIIWKTDVIKIVDSMNCFGRTEISRLKDDRCYQVTVRFGMKEYGLFLNALMRLSRDGFDIRNPIIRTTIFGLEL